MFYIDSDALKHHNYIFSNVQERQKTHPFDISSHFNVFGLDKMYEVLTHHYRYVLLLHICYLIEFYNIVLFCLPNAVDW